MTTTVHPPPPPPSPVYADVKVDRIQLGWISEHQVYVALNLNLATFLFYSVWLASVVLLLCLFFWHWTILVPYCPCSKESQCQAAEAALA